MAFSTKKIKAKYYIWLAKDIGHFISDENFKKIFNELIELRPKKEKEEINFQVKEFIENFDLVYKENNYLY